MEASLVIVWLSFIANVQSKSLILQKCCPNNYVYNVASKKCGSVDQNLVVDWIPDQIKNQQLFNRKNFTLVLPTSEEFDFRFGPCPEIFENVLAPILVDSNAALELNHDDPEASLKIDGRTYDQWCFDATISPSKGLMQRQWVLLACPCLHETCITRCCQQSYRLQINKASAISFLRMCSGPGVTSWRASVENLHLARNDLKPWVFRYLTLYEHMENCLHSVHKDYGKIRRPKLIEDFQIDERGILTSNKYTATKLKYCVAESLVNGQPKTVAMLCDKSEFVISYEEAGTQSALAAVGAFFSALTLAIHALSRDLRKGIKGLSLIAHCAAMLCAYLTLAFRPLAWSQETDACIILGTFTHFFLLSSFFWLNVRAIIIHATFRSLNSMLSGLSLDTKSFPLYALYAIGVPACVSGFMAWAQFTEDSALPLWIIWPDMDEATCWFRSSLGRAIYFSLPMGVLLIVNVVLFISTFIKINAFRRENLATLNADDDNVQNSTLRDNLKFDTKRLKLFANLSLLMGLTYLSEFFSWINYLFSLYWYASNVAIALRALFLFVVFCCKKKVWVSLRRQYPRLDKFLTRVGVCFQGWINCMPCRGRFYHLSELSDESTCQSQVTSSQASGRSHAKGANHQHTTKV